MKVCLKASLAGCATAMAGVLLALSPFGADFEQALGLAWLFDQRGPIAAPQEMVVLAITEQTGEQLGLSKLPREWPRSIHARLVENLTRRGVSAIVFDMDFQQARQAQEDAEFARAAAESGRVVLVEKLVGKRQPLLNAAGKQTGSVWVEQLLPPIPELAAAVKGLGAFPVPKLQVAVQQFWAFKDSINAATMPVAALQIHTLSIYAHLQSWMEQAGLNPPPPPAANAHAAELRDFMQAVRSVFVQHPELGLSLSKRLSSEQEAGLSPTERQGLQALIGLYAGDDNRYFNFYGPPGTIHTLPYQLFAQNPEQQAAANAELPDLRGKVVFVGFSDLYDPGQPDRFYTVFSNAEGVDLSGVEIAATAFGNLLTDSSLRVADSGMQMLLLAGFGGVLGCAAYWLPAMLSVPLLLLLASAYAYLALWLFSTGQLWLPVAVPLLVQLPLALFIGLLTQYLRERKKKKHAAQAISRYLPENLARDFTENSLDESALNRVAYCVCFASDMAGFTSIAEILSPKALSEFLNDYFETLSAPLKRHGVDVLEFRADGIMCAWTAEQAEAQLRQQALLAALEATEAIRAFQQRHSQFAHALRIGIEHGMAYVGHAGGGGHFVYSIVGDCANTAARIEGLNKKLHTQILVSRSALEGVTGLLTRHVGDFRFVGKTEALPIVEVLAELAQASLAQIELVQRFQAALGLLGQGDYPAAAERFAALVKDYPDDGPSRFHLAHSRDLTARPTPSENPLLICLDSK